MLEFVEYSTFQCSISKYQPRVFYVIPISQIELNNVSLNFGPEMGQNTFPIPPRYTSLYNSISRFSSLSVGIDSILVCSSISVCSNIVDL